MLECEASLHVKCEAGLFNTTGILELSGMNICLGRNQDPAASTTSLTKS